MTETRPRGADNDVSASRSAFTLSRRSHKCAPTSGPTATVTAEAHIRTANAATYGRARSRRACRMGAACTPAKPTSKSAALDACPQQQHGDLHDDVCGVALRCLAT